MDLLNVCVHGTQTHAPTLLPTKMGKFSSFTPPRRKTVSQQQQWQRSSSREPSPVCAGKQESCVGVVGRADQPYCGIWPSSGPLWLMSLILSCPWLHWGHFRWTLGWGPEQGGNLSYTVMGYLPWVGGPGGSSITLKLSLGVLFPPLFGHLWTQLQLQRVRGTAWPPYGHRPPGILTSFIIQENPPLIKSPGLH